MPTRNDDVITRFTDAAAHARARVTAAPAPLPHAERALGFQFAPGDRVVDLVTGHIGVVDAGHPTADLVHAAQPTSD